MEQILSKLLKKFHMNLCIYRNYYNFNNIDESLNDFYLNACFIHTIGDFEKQLSALLQEILKLDNNLKDRFLKLCKIVDLVDKEKNINNLILVSRNRILVLAHLILNTSFNLDKIEFIGSKRGSFFKLNKSEDFWSYSDSKRENLNPDEQISKSLFFFEEAYQRRNALIHRSGNADEDYIRLAKLKIKSNYEDLKINDKSKQYLIDNKFFSIFQSTHAHRYSKSESFKEDLLDCDLVVQPHYYSHVIMKLQFFLYYFLKLSFIEKQQGVVENYLEEIFSYCIGFDHYIKNAESKYLFDNCRILIDDFFDNANLGSVKNQYIFAYALYILDKCDARAKKSLHYKKFINNFNTDILVNGYANFYNALINEDYEKMKDIFEKLYQDKVINSKKDILKNLIFTQAVPRSEFRDLCKEKFKSSVSPDDFINKFSEQFK